MGMRSRVRLMRRALRLGELLDAAAEIHGDRRLVEQPEPITLAGGATTLTVERGAQLVARTAEVLAPRCHGGRRMVVRGPNDYGFFLACLAVSRAGGVVVPVNPRMSPEEVDHVIEDAGAEMIETEALEEMLDGSKTAGDMPPVATDDDVAGIFYTSGTTGRPKGARLGHSALVDPAAFGGLWLAGLRRDEMVASLPIAHIMGFATLVGAAGVGIPVYFLPRFSPTAVLDAIESRRATVFVGVPAMYQMMLEAGAEERDLTSVRMWISGADVMPGDTARRFKRMGATVTLPVVGRSLGEALFVQGYGMVELGGAAAVKVSPPGTGLGLGDFLGFGLRGRRLKVVDDEGQDADRGEVGELLVRAPGALRGYHGDPDRTAEVLTDEGWVRTGDLARRGRLGVVRFAGRKKDVLMHGGYSVYPPEVEETLRGHPAVADVAVVGRPDRVKGEVPVAFVRLRSGSGATTDEILAFGREYLADYKAPVEVRVVDEFERTGTGKIDKQVLRSRLNSV